MTTGNLKSQRSAVVQTVSNALEGFSKAQTTTKLQGLQKHPNLTSLTCRARFQSGRSRKPHPLEERRILITYRILLSLVGTQCLQENSCRPRPSVATVARTLGWMVQTRQFSCRGRGAWGCNGNGARRQRHYGASWMTSCLSGVSTPHPGNQVPSRPRAPEHVLYAQQGA